MDILDTAAHCENLEAHSTKTKFWVLSNSYPEVNHDEPFLSQDIFEKYSYSHLNLLRDVFGLTRDSEPRPSYGITKAVTCKTTREKKTFSEKEKNTFSEEVIEKYSTLSLDEQKNYLKLLSLYKDVACMQPTQNELAEIKLLGDLHTAVSEEQEQFNHYIKETAVTRKHIYDYLHPEAERYIKDLLTSKLQSCLRYPRGFSLETIIPFLTVEKILKESPVDFIHQKTVLELGRIPRLVMSSYKANTILPLSYDKVQKRFSPSHSSAVHPSRNCCSQDEISISLSERYAADITLSFSAFRAMILVPPYEDEWELPVTVQFSQNGHKTVFIDKPVPQCPMKGPELSQIYHKYALRTLLTNVKPCKVKPLEKLPSENIRITRASTSLYDLFDLKEADITDLESFGNKPSRKRTLSKCESSKFRTKSWTEKETKEDELLGLTKHSQEVAAVIEDLIQNVSSSFNISNPVDSDEEMLIIDSHMSCDEESSNRIEPSSDNVELLLERETNKESFENTDSVAAMPQSPVNTVADDSFHSLEIDIPSSPKEQIQDFLETPQSPTDLSSPEKPIRMPIVIPSSPVNDQLEDPLSGSTELPLNAGQLLMHVTKEIPTSPVLETLTSDILEAKDAISSFPVKERKVEERCEKAIDYPKTDGNVRYSIWKLGNLNILLRCKMDSLKPPQGEPWLLYPKLEYLSQHAAEENSLKQLIHQWAMLVTRPGSQLLRARINALTSEILMFEEFSFDQLLNSCEITKSKFKPQCALRQLHSVMEILNSLQVGQYMLIHKKNETVASLYKENEKRTLDLHTIINTRLVDVEDGKLRSKDIIFHNLNPALMFPHFISQNKVPALFPVDGGKNSKKASPKGKRRGKPRKTKENKNK